MNNIGLKKCRSMSESLSKLYNNCKLFKPSTGKVQMELHPIPKVEIPWHTGHIDISGRLSGKNDLKEYIIVLIDEFTKYVFLYHHSENCINAVKAGISLFGVPSRIIADQGRTFASGRFRDFCSSNKIHYIKLQQGQAGQTANWSA